MDDVPAPLVATADDELAEQALRWCAAVAATPRLVPDVGGVRRGWRTAPVVLVGADLAPALGQAGLPRRDHVLLLAGPGHDAWPLAVGIGAVDVLTAAEESRALEALTLALDGRDEGCLVAVVGATGGAGASTFAAALGLRGVGRGLDSLLLDLDPLGGGLDLVLGAERVPGLRWQELGGTDGTVSAGSLAHVLPRRDGLATLTWSRDLPVGEPAALPAVLDAATRGFDLVVADLPRHPTASTLDVVGRAVCTVVLVPEETRALGAASALLGHLEEATSTLAVVGVARRGGIGPDLVSRGVGRPVLGRVHPDRGLRPAVEQGHGPRRSRTLRKGADVVLDLLGLEAAPR